MSDARQTIIIEDGVPMPTPHMKPLKYPFGKMKIGQSFVMPIERRHLVDANKNGYERNHPGVTFTSRAEGEYVRVWRIS